MMQRSLRFRLAVFLGALALFGCLSVFLATGRLSLSRDNPEIVALSSRWVSAVADRNPGFVDLLSTSSVEYYEHLRDVALHGGVSELNALGPTDQLQALFLRLTIETKQLQEISGREILVRAVDEHWIGQDLRRTDELREVVVDGDAATGRLYKFGRDERPDRGRQYFVRENGKWRVDLRGERERLRVDFESFVARSGLVPSEAAFFILEMRLLRKVMPADFVPPGRDWVAEIGRVSVPKERQSAARLRLVAIRESLDDSSLTAVTVEDREKSLRSVLYVGDSVGGEDGHRLARVEGGRAWLVRGGASLELRLEPEGFPLDRRLRFAGKPDAEVSLLGQARLGEHREGLMAQWRNVGLRGRPQLLQQAWLVPEFAVGRESLMGLRVRKLVEGSFWHQLGLAEGDLLERLNGDRIDSMDQWQALVRAAEMDKEISVAIRRDGRSLRFHTKTVPPRGLDKPV
ncbi:MAG TPA: hypothetical protein EYG54_07270 [Myxococcales bacterium]|nr:hypothetical protein [Myxococcales bacterium]